MKLFQRAALVGLAGLAASAACSASSKNQGSGGATSGAGGASSSSTSGANGGGGQANTCGACLDGIYTSCDSGSPKGVQCPDACTPGKGCTACVAGGTLCKGNVVVACDANGNVGAPIVSCDGSKGEECDQGMCKNGCDLANDSPSNLGCEFWAADLDMADGPTDPASAPWGLVLSNAGQAAATVTIELNEAPVGQPVKTKLVQQLVVMPGDLAQVTMPTRELDCGKMPNDHTAPGSCLTSNAFRIKSSVPIVVYQFNNLAHNYSTDASLLLPTSVLGTKYRVIGWPSGHPVDLPGAFVERAYITVIGTQPNTDVTVSPTWKIRGNMPIPATMSGGMLKMTIGPFDVLNLESDDATLNECLMMQKPPYCSDLTGSTVESSAPVVVFSGTESSGVSPDALGAPTPPGWAMNDFGGCCLQHLEEQLFPLESIGKTYVVTRSPVRSTSGNYEEPDVIRFVGAAETATVTTNLPPPFDSFTITPGQILDTWTQKDFVASSTAPILIGHYLVAGGWVDPNPKGDPSFLVVPPVEQARKDYVFLSPDGWTESWVVIAAEPATKVTIDGAAPPGCIVMPAGAVGGKTYEARRCPLTTGVHRLSGSDAFGIIAYGFADADAYSFAGGAGVKKIYDVPPLK